MTGLSWPQCVNCQPTPEMLDLARAKASRPSATNVEIRQGEIEAIPLPARQHRRPDDHPHRVNNGVVWPGFTTMNGTLSGHLNDQFRTAAHRCSSGPCRTCSACTTSRAV